MRNKAARITGYDELDLAKVIRGYLLENLSHRTIQREILHLPAPSRGGGFVAMEILHYFGLHGDLKNAGIEVLDKKGFEEARQIVNSIKALEKEADLYFLNQNINPNGNSTEKNSLIKSRVYQDKLRSVILDNYNFHCALCEINKEDLLCCSHIKSWKLFPEERLNPSNAICLCALHDKLFDKGYFSLDHRYNIIYTSKTDKQIKFLLSELTFKKPKINPPNIDSLQFHFKSFN